MVANAQVKSVFQSRNHRLVALHGGITLDSSCAGDYRYVRYPGGVQFNLFQRTGISACHLGSDVSVEHARYPHARDSEGDWMMVSGRHLREYTYRRGHQLVVGGDDGKFVHRFLRDSLLEEKELPVDDGMELLEYEMDPFELEQEERYREYHEEYCLKPTKVEKGVFLLPMVPEPAPVILPTSLVRLPHLCAKRLPGGYVWMGAGRMFKKYAGVNWFRRNERGVLTTYDGNACKQVQIANAARRFERCLRRIEEVEARAAVLAEQSLKLLVLLEELAPEILVARCPADQFIWDQLARDAYELRTYRSCLGDKARFLAALNQAAHRCPLVNTTAQEALKNIGGLAAEIDDLGQAGNHRQAEALAASGIQRAHHMLVTPRG